MRTTITQLVFVSAIVMSLAQTLTREYIFEPLRRRLGGKETWLGYLVSCPYCASHGIAFVLVPVTGTYIVDTTIHAEPFATFLRWFLSSILVTVIAAFLRVVFWLVDEQQALARKEKQLVDDTNRTSRDSTDRWAVDAHRQRSVRWHSADQLWSVSTLPPILRGVTSLQGGRTQIGARQITAKAGSRR